MAAAGHEVALLSRKLNFEQCINLIRLFREGKRNILITTNVHARGMDIEHVNY